VPEEWAEPLAEPMFGQFPDRGAKRRVLWAAFGAADRLGVVFEPVAAPAAPAPIAITAVVPTADSRYLRLRIEILPSVLETVKLTALCERSARGA